MTSATPHVLTPGCPLWCLEYELPANSFNALKRDMRWRFDGHPTVGHVADLHRRELLGAIRRLGVGGIARIGQVLAQSGILTEPGRQLASDQPGS